MGRGDVSWARFIGNWAMGGREETGAVGGGVWWSWAARGMGESESAGVESWHDRAGRGLDFPCLVTCGEAAELLEATSICLLSSQLICLS